MFRCPYCQHLKFKKYYFENDVMCKDCYKIVPKWTCTLREELNKLNIAQNFAVVRKRIYHIL